MRKSLLVLFFLMIGIGMMSSQSITVTSPHAGDTWYKTNSYTITWTKTGDQHARVKIRLYDPTGTDKILNIVDDTANDGSFPWAIPGSVAAGRYVVRVKTLDNEVYDDSEVFEIKAPTFRRRPQPPVRLAQDLEIRDIYYKGGWIVARVKSNVNHFKGRVKFGIVLNTLSNSITNIFYSIYWLGCTEITRPVMISRTEVLI